MTLAAWLAQENVSPAMLAARLGVARQTVYSWMTGDFGPSRKHLVQLCVITNNKVTVLDFDQPIVAANTNAPSGDLCGQT